MFVGLKYAGVQNGNQCFCGNSYGRYGVKSESDCNKKCSGNADQICGGSWRNNVYSTGISKFNTSSAHQLHFHGCCLFA